MRRRYLVRTDFLAPRLLSRQRRFWFRRSAERHALLFDSVAWSAGFLTKSTVSRLT